MTESEIIEAYKQLEPKFKPLDAVKAYKSGVTAKKFGMMRVSPYYEHPQADACWFAGYDGIPFHEVNI